MIRLKDITVEDEWHQGCKFWRFKYPYKDKYLSFYFGITEDLTEKYKRIILKNVRDSFEEKIKEME